MDAIVGLLDGTRARGAFILRSVLDPPWSMRILDEAPLTLVAVVHGGAWIVSDADEPAHHERAGGEPLHLTEGDIAIVRGPHHYTVADHPDTPPHVVIHPGQRCSTPTGDDVATTMGLGIRAWGNSPNGATMMLTGTYESHSTVARPLLEALPPVIVLRRSEWESPLIDVLRAEAMRNEPGQDVVLDRLLDLLTVAVVRTWFAQHDSLAPKWWRATNDPIIGPALRLLHNNPARAWTVAILAAEAAVSRAGLARRFTDLVGEPPMAYLTRWRLSLAADFLREPNTTVSSVAERVGYGSAFAMSTAFKRHHGVSPQQHRLAANTRTGDG